MIAKDEITLIVFRGRLSDNKSPQVFMLVGWLYGFVGYLMPNPF